jgi:hypothetical protein
LSFNFKVYTALYLFSVNYSGNIKKCVSTTFVKGLWDICEIMAEPINIGKEYFIKIINDTTGGSFNTSFETLIVRS